MLGSLLLAFPFVAAQAPPTNPAPVVDQAEAKVQTPAQELADLDQRYYGSELAFDEKLKTFEIEYQKLADKYQGQETGLRAELVMLQNCWYLDAAERTGVAKGKVEHILKLYAASPFLGLITKPIRYLIPKPEQDALLQRIANGNQHDAVKAAVLFARARAAKGENRTKMFELLTKKYGKLKHLYSSYADLAHAHLNPHKAEDLKVGKAAPEIVGMGLDGKPMRLSDYRGKVVVLDFWGDW
ncbi:MAG: redoxin domain-containing protein [Planctomycetes bacterium]|nr:redoxin domain-containing protein [Planctomycetota bacterium]MCP4771054.1 redoxin domain-containing protein [Planctomycetota bacterium]MCP4861929.1 redoxin domain-containing protein [Planctomycetota bacterium]